MHHMSAALEGKDCWRREIHARREDTMEGGQCRGGVVGVRRLRSDDVAMLTAVKPEKGGDSIVLSSDILATWVSDAVDEEEERDA